MPNSLTLLADNLAIDASTDEIPQEAPPSIMQRLKAVTSLSEILRLFGACAVIASMSLFMLEGWSEGNDIQRYLKLLGQTGLLTTAGLILSYVLKEYKGARLFFGLSLTSVVANFTILGALIYSMFQLDGALQQYPEMATWVAVNAQMFWPLCIGAIALLGILARFSFSIFSRHIAGQLTVYFLLLNTLLLVPVRSTISVSLLLVISLCAAAALVRKLSREEKLVFTWEAKFALSTLFMPSLIIAARAICLYHVDELLLLSFASIGYVALRFLHNSIDEQKVFARAVELTQCALGFCIALLAAEMVPYTVVELQPIVFSLILFAFCVDLVKHSEDLNWNSVSFNFTAWALVIGNVLLAFVGDSLVLQTSSLIISLVIWFTASRIENANAHKSRAIALTGAGFSLWFMAWNLIALAQLSSWIIFGLIGVLLIVGASLYERFGIRFSRFIN